MRNRGDTRLAFSLSPGGGEIQRGGAGSYSRAARQLLAAATALALLLLACTQTPADVNNAGHEPFEQAELEATPGAAIEAYSEALSAYEDAQLRVPEKGEPYYNAANALYRMEDYEGALREYDDALIWAEDDLRAKGFFNKGNVYFDTEQYPLAIEEYKKVLRIDPDNEDAKHNLELAMSMLPQQEEQEQGEEPEENDQQGPEQQEQEQQDQQQDQQQEGPENEEEQQEEQQDEEQEGEEGDQEEDEQPQQQPQARPQTEPITEEQARQLLQSVADDAETLQERLQQVLVSPEPTPVNPW